MKRAGIVRSLSVLAASVLLQLGPMPPSGAATCTVSPGPGTPLKNALADASCTTIVLKGGTFSEYAPVIGRSLTLRGAGMGSTTITGNSGARALTVNGAGIAVTISDLALANTAANDYGAGLLVTGDADNVVRLNRLRVWNNDSSSAGGGIWIQAGRVFIRESEIHHNTGAYGGGVGNYGGRLTVDRTRIAWNTAVYGGGGIYSQVSSLAALLTLRDSRVSRNSVTGADGWGGGIYVGSGSTASIERVTLDGNVAGGADSFGGGIYAAGLAQVVNTTVSGNRATSAGGGIYGAANVSLSHLTIARNSVDGSGGGGLMVGSTTAATVRNSIFADNVNGSSAAANCGLEGFSSLTVTGSIEKGATTCSQGSGALVADPRLGHLRANGAPRPVLSPTHAVPVNSPARNLGKGHCQPVDQRGAPRGSPCDAGSHEVVFCDRAVVTRLGTASSDRIAGSVRSDVILALGGNDRIIGGRGKDRICAGSGRDSILGGRGGDRLFGQSGNDLVHGGAGFDLCRGGAGKDVTRRCEA